MKRVVFSPAAREDPLAIGLCIADDSPARAESFITELEAKAMEIGARPRSFPLREDVSSGVRSAVHGRYLIVFRDLEHDVCIVRILHGSRNLPHVLDT